MVPQELDFYSDQEREVRADPRIYAPSHEDWTISRLSDLYQISLPKFLALVVHFRRQV